MQDKTSKCGYNPKKLVSLPLKSQKPHHTSPLHQTPTIIDPCIINYKPFASIEHAHGALAYFVNYFALVKSKMMQGAGYCVMLAVSFILSFILANTEGELVKFHAATSN